MNKLTQKELNTFLWDEFNQILEDDADTEIKDLINQLNTVQDPGPLFEKFLKDIGIIGNQLKLIKKSFEALKFYKEKMQKRKQGQKKNVVPDVKETIDLFTNQKILLSELVNDKQKIPPKCSQYMLYDVLINGLLLKYPILIPEYEKLPDAKKHPPYTQQKLMEKIKELRNKISEENRLSPDIKTIFTNIEFNKNDLFDNLISLKKDLIGIDVCDLSRLIEKTKKAEKDIAGKSIVLFIGDTGAGKTTTILGLYGFTMVKKKFKGMDWVAPLQTITDETLKLLHTSPQQKSITRYPLAILPKQKLSNSQQVWFVDTPGFGDSAGVEVDLANGIGTINTIKGCKSVKSIVVISKQSWGTRGTGIKKLARILGSLFGNYKNVQDSVMFIWNRFPQDELRELNLKITDLIEHTTPQQKINQNLMSLLEDLAEKTQEYKQIIHYNPLVKDAHKNILAKIKKLKQLKRPEQYFDLAFTENTKSRIKQQCLVYQNIINYQFEKTNLECVAYYLQNFKNFESLVRMNTLTQSYQTLEKSLSKKIKLRFNKCEQNLMKKIKNNNLEKDDLTNFKDQSKILQKMYQSMCQFIQIPNPDTLKINIETQMESLINCLNQQETINITLVKKILLIDHELDLKIKSTVKKKLQIFYLIVRKRIQNNFCNHKYADAVSSFQFLKQLIKMKFQCEPQMKVKQKQEFEKDQLILRPINEKIKQYQKYVNLVKQQNINKINQITVELIDIQKCYSLMEVLGKDGTKINQKINKAYSSLNTQANNQIILLEKFIKQSKEGNNNSDLIQTKIKKIKLLLTINYISNDISIKYETCMNKIQMYVLAQQEILKSISDAIKSQNQYQKKQIKFLIKDLDQALMGIQKLSQYIEAQNVKILCKRISKDIIEEINSYLEEKLKIIETIELQLTLKKDMLKQKLIQLVNTFDEIKHFCQIKSLPKQIIEQMKKKTQNKLNNLLINVQKINIEIDIKQLKDQNIHFTNRYKKIRLDRIQNCILVIISIEKIISSKTQKNKINTLSIQFRTKLNEIRSFLQEITFKKFDGLRNLKKEIAQQDIRIIKKILEMFGSVEKYKEIKVMAFDDIENTRNQILEKVSEQYNKFKKQIKNLNNTNLQKLSKLKSTLQNYQNLDSLLTKPDSFKTLLMDIEIIRLGKVSKIEEQFRRYLAQNNYPMLKKTLKTTKQLKSAENQHMHKLILDKLIQKIDINIEKIKKLRSRGIQNEQLLEQSVNLCKIKIWVTDQLQDQAKKKINKCIMSIEKQVSQKFDQKKSEIQHLLKNNYIDEAYSKCKLIKPFQIIMKALKDHQNYDKNNFMNSIYGESQQNKSEDYVHDEFKNQVMKQQKLFKEKYLNNDNFKIDNTLKLIYQHNFQNPIQKETKTLKKLIDVKIEDHFTLKLSKFQKQQNVKLYLVLKNELQNIISNISQSLKVKYEQQYNKCLIKKNSKMVQYKQKLQQNFMQNQQNQIYKKLIECITNQNVEIIQMIRTHLSNKLDIFFQNLKLNQKIFINIRQLDNFLKLILRDYNNIQFIHNIFQKFVEKTKNQIQKNASKYISSAIQEKNNLKQLYQSVLIQNSSLKNSQHKDSNHIQSIFHKYIDPKQNPIKINTINNFINNIKQHLYQSVKQFHEGYIELKNSQFYSSLKPKFAEIQKDIFKQFLKINKQNYVDANIIFGETVMSTKPIEKLKTLSNIQKCYSYIKYIILQNPNEYQIFFAQIRLSPQPKQILKEVKQILQKCENLLEKFNLKSSNLIRSDNIFRKKHLNLILSNLTKIKQYQEIYQEIFQKKEDMFQKYSQKIKNQFIKVQEDTIKEIINLEIYKGINQYEFEIINSTTQILNISAEIFSFENQSIKKQIEKQFKNKIKQISQRIISNQIIALKNCIEQSNNQEIKIRNQYNLIKNAQIQNIRKQSTILSEQNMIKLTKIISSQQDEQKKKQYISAKQSAQITHNNQLNQNIQKIYNQYSQVLKKQIDKIQIKKEDKRQALAKSLIEIKTYEYFIFCVKQYCKSQFQRIMKAFLQKIQKKYIKSLVMTIKNESTPIAEKLLSQLPQFQNYQQNNFIKASSKKGIDEVLAEFQLQNSQKEKLKKLFIQYEEKYNSYLKLYKDNPNNKVESTIINNIKSQVITLKSDYKIQKCTDGNLLIANIFALWSILKSIVSQDGVQFLYRPHPSQIIAIFCILGIGDTKNNFKIMNRFAQVQTGEGKSIIFAGLSCYLGLLDYQVSCVCYSQYLSKRDSSHFSQLFEKLQLTKKIKYGTFNELCQKILNYEEFNFRVHMKVILKNFDPNPSFFQKLKYFANIISQQAKGLAKGLFKSLKALITKQPKKILLIDQVDVFFQRSFYGNLYQPTISFKHECVNKLFAFIWKNRLSVTSQTVDKSQQYKQFKKIYPTLELLINEAIKGMISSAKQWSKEYNSQPETLYKKIFTSFYECEKGNIPETIKNELIQLKIKIGQFSYAELPKNFQCILGITGTLKVLQQCKKKIIKEEYNINQQFYLPSVYGDSRRQHKGIKFVKKQFLYQQIMSQINEYLKKDRSIIVFFQQVSEANKFNIYLEQKDVKVNFLTQQHDPDTRQYRINKATTIKTVSVMTRIFGRGTDFVINDKKLKQSGGLHVIQAFLSDSKSQQIQIMGRCARQGDQGSYSLIVQEQQIKKYDVKINQINEIKKLNIEIKEETRRIFALIDKRRQNKQEKFYSKSKENAKKLKINHERSLMLFQYIQQEKFKDIFEYVISLNKQLDIKNK